MENEWRVMKVKMSWMLFLGLAAFLALTPGRVAAATGEEALKVRQASEVLGQIMNIPENNIPRALLDNAQAVAVIPDVLKGALVVGGRYGTGVMVVRTADGTWSRPAFISLSGASVGWQIGAQSSDIVLVFRDKSAVDAIQNGTFTLGVQASIAAGPVGRDAEIGTDIRLDSAIYSYSRTKGVFAGAALNGAALNIDERANADFYGIPGITVARIFGNELIQAPMVANNFTCTVARYTRTTQMCG